MTPKEYSKTPEFLGHRIMLMILRCKNATDRAALCYGTLRRSDVVHLLAGLDWALERGFVIHKVSAQNERRNGTDRAPAMYYLTKSGKAWLRAQGSDFGSAKYHAAIFAT